MKNQIITSQKGSLDYFMKTLVLQEPHNFKFEQQEKPNNLTATEVLIQIKKIGICGTDYHAYRGKQPFFSYPRILGHELGAEVIAIGNAVKNLTVGDKVTVEPYLNCGHCQPCFNGKSNCCENLQVLGVHTHGGMAEYIKVPYQKLHVSNEMTFEQLAVVEPLSIGAHAVDRAQVGENDIVLVIGAGPIGLSVIQFAKIQKAMVIVLDINNDRLKFAKDNLNADFTICLTPDFDATTIQDLIQKSNFGKNASLPTVVFDATGNPESMKNAFNYVAFGGKLVYVGLFIGDVVFHDPLFHRRELTLLASRNSLPKDFKRIIQLIESGQINVDNWITHRASFDELPHIFEHWLQPSSGVVKAMVTL